MAVCFRSPSDIDQAYLAQLSASLRLLPEHLSAHVCAERLWVQRPQSVAAEDLASCRIVGRAFHADAKGAQSVVRHVLYQLVHLALDQFDAFAMLLIQPTVAAPLSNARAALEAFATALWCLDDLAPVRVHWSPAKARLRFDRTLSVQCRNLNESLDRLREFGGDESRAVAEMAELLRFAHSVGSIVRPNDVGRPIRFGKEAVPKSSVLGTMAVKLAENGSSLRLPGPMPHAGLYNFLSAPNHSLYFLQEELGRLDLPLGLSREIAGPPISPTEFYRTAAVVLVGVAYFCIDRTLDYLGQDTRWLQDWIRGIERIL
jgi:hypothetical protein